MEKETQNKKELTNEEVCKQYISSKCYKCPLFYCEHNQAARDKYQW